jgi:hypothetical protein
MYVCLCYILVLFVNVSWYLSYSDTRPLFTRQTFKQIIFWLSQLNAHGSWLVCEAAFTRLPGLDSKPICSNAIRSPNIW